jgi:hypothetical protein
VTAVLNYLIIALIGISVIAASFFIIRATRSRSRTSREAYGVGQQDARQSMQVNITRGVGFIILGLILLGVYGLSSRPVELEPELQINTPTKIASTSTVTILPTPTVTAILLELTPTPTQAVSPATITPLPEPTEIPPSSSPQTAIVISEVGVWLRGTPGTAGEQLEWVLNGTVLTLLPGEESVDDFEWQQVRTPDGNEGWVATDYIELVNQ